METREKSIVYLIGSYEHEILGAKLPSLRQTFGYFLYLHKVHKRTIRDASRETIEVVTTFWIKAGIPTRGPQHCIQKLETIFTEWKALQKHKNRTTDGHRTREEKFLEQLDDVFDIAHADALTLINIPEDQAFLLSQREKGRPGSMASVDMVQARRTQRAHDRADAELRRHQ
jgi:hypothetical protein